MKLFYEGISKGFGFLPMLALLSACGGGSGNTNDDADNSNTENTYSIGGIVSGLSGATLVLQNNDGDDLTITSDGEFNFATPLPNSSAYGVAVSAQPNNQQCTVTNGSGSVAGADITDVVISCLLNAVTPSVSTTGPKLLRFSWNDVGADHYRLLYNPDANSGYSQVGEEIWTTSVEEEISVHLIDWLNATYLVQACNLDAVCTDSEPMNISSSMLDAIGYIKAGYIGDNREFGNDIALSGDGRTLAIGIPDDGSSVAPELDDGLQIVNGDSISEGGIYLFVQDDNSWEIEAYIKASTHSTRFGYRVAISDDGNTLATCTSQQWTTGGGTLYLYTRNGSVWTEQTYFRTPNIYADDRFCSELDISGDGKHVAVSSELGIYLFDLRNSVWYINPVPLTLPYDPSFRYFDSSLALSSDATTLAVGNRAENSATTDIDGDHQNSEAISSGAVYILVSDGDAWAQQAYIKASNTELGDEFGGDIALSADGNTLAVGAMEEDSAATGVNGDQSDNSTRNSGAVYLFERQGSDWEQSAYIKASYSNSDFLINANFGYRVALSADGEYLAVSSSGEMSSAVGINGDQTDMQTEAPPGAVYLYERSDSTWLQKAYVKASNTDSGFMSDPIEVGTIGAPPYLIINDGFGASIALSEDGSTLVVGAPRENSGDPDNQTDDSAPYSGAVYLY